MERQADLREGLAECFYLVKPYRTLVFKWKGHEIRVSEFIALTDAKPLFGGRCGKVEETH